MTEADSPIQIDDSDRDSSYNDSDAASETSSLRSSIFKFVYENGRRYHSFRAGTYWGPNDEKAQDNLDLFHHIFTLSLDGKLFLAPINPKPQRVLDLGTGTGIWAMDFADDYPSASVIATDLSPIQPDFIPSNLEIQIDDFTAPWTFAPESFDFIHARSIYGCVADYPALYAEVYNALKPGAYFQQAEISVVPKSEDGSIAGTHMEQWGPLALEAGEKFGKSFRIAEDSKALIEQAGFVNVTYRRFKWPIGPWPKDPKLKEIGSFNRLGWEDGVEGWAMYLFTKYLGWRIEEIQVLIAGIRKELRDSAIHGYQEMTVCYGQRPPG
jgi:SAM-dependent methyltransferase